MATVHLDREETRRFLSRRGFLVGTAGLTALSMVGCRSAVSGDGDGEAGGDAQSLVLATPAAPDPTGLLHRQVDTPSYINLVFDRLVDLDPDTLQPLPWLATEWEWAEDRMSLRLALRDDVTWHSGRAFGPEDVIFTLNAAQDPEARSQVAGILSQIASVEATGDHEVTIILGKPTSNLFDALAFNPIVDSDTYDESAGGQDVIGTGPFVWSEYTAGQELVVTANADYWAGAPGLQTITVRAVENAQALISGLQSGQMQLVGGVPGRDIGVLADDDRYTLLSVESSYQQTYLAADTTTAPFDDLRVRQALQHAVDRQRVVEQVYGGFGKVSCVPWPASTPGVTEDQVTRYGFDPDRARELIDEAGATGAKITVFAASTPIFTSVMEIVQYNLSEIGFDVTAEALEKAEFGDRVRGGDLPGLFIANVGLVSVSPLTGISTAAPLRPDGNPSHLDSPEYVDLQTRAFAATSDEEAAEVNSDLSEFLLEQSFHITLAQAFETYAMTADLTGVETNLLGYLKLGRATLG